MTASEDGTISDADITALTAEAEAGYDVDELIARRPKRGRPALGSGPATVESVRLDPELRALLLQRAEADETTPSAVIRAALSVFLLSDAPNVRSVHGRQYRSAMSSPNKRTVTPHSDGWSVEKPGSSRASSVHQTQQQAIDAARQTLANSGGGELAIKGRDGAVRSQDTIKPGSDPRRSRG